MTDFPDVYPVTRGATLPMVLRVKAGSVAGTEVVTCTGKKIEAKVSPPPSGDPAADFSMTVVFAAASGDEPDRWYLTLTDEDCESLALGYYAVDARIETAAGQVVQEQHWVIYVRERVTGPAA